jgi:hypothetical protein
MSTTRGKRIIWSHEIQHSARLESLRDRWLDAYRMVRQRVADFRGSRATDDLRQVAESRPSEPDLLSGGEDAQQSELDSLPQDRSEALASLCDRLLRELSGPEVKAAEIRFVIHKHDRPAFAPMDAGVDPACGELAWELHRLIASAGATVADVVRALDLRGADLTDNGRELLQDEVTTLDDDLSLLKAHLADPGDWDAALECLLGGEIAPFDDPHADEESDNDD